LIDKHWAPEADQVGSRTDSTCESVRGLSPHRDGRGDMDIVRELLDGATGEFPY